MKMIPETLRNRARFGAAATALLLAPHVAHAQSSWSGFLLGTNENPVNGSTASGFVSLTLLVNSLTITLNFSGLTGGNASVAHIHCCIAPGGNAGVAIPFLGFPSATSGFYTNTVDLTLTASYAAAFLTLGGGTAAGAQAALITGLNAGQVYVNIHNTVFPGGEIRANVAPEPSSVLLMGAGLAGLGVLASRRRRKNG